MSDTPKQTAPAPDGWHPADTAPENGSEFEYICNDGRVRVGSLGHDLGSSIKRDYRMIGWREMQRDCPCGNPEPHLHASDVRLLSKDAHLVVELLQAEAEYVKDVKRLRILYLIVGIWFVVLLLTGLTLWIAGPIL